MLRCLILCTGFCTISVRISTIRHVVFHSFCHNTQGYPQAAAIPVEWAVENLLALWRMSGQTVLYGRTTCPGIHSTMAGVAFSGI